MTRSLRLLAALGLILATAACSSPASQSNMTVYSGATAVNPALKGKMALRNVTGGKDTNPLWTSQVDNAGFKGALQESLVSAGYITQSGASPLYTIDAELQSLDQPIMGLTLDVKSTVLYSVQGNNIQRSYPITVTGSASVSDAFTATQRLKIANERAIQENIKAFLAQLDKGPF